MTALLDAFPDAAVFELPGYLWGRPIGRVFTFGMLRHGRAGLPCFISHRTRLLPLDRFASGAHPRRGRLRPRLAHGKTLDY